MLSKDKKRSLEQTFHRVNDVSVPDKDFNPARNKAVIDETIREAEEYHKKVHAALDDAMGERIEAVSAYGRYRFNRGFKDVKGYLGRKYYNQLVGEQILEKVRVMDTVNKLNRNTKFKKHILL